MPKAKGESLKRRKTQSHDERREEASRRMLDAAFDLIAKSGLESLSLTAVGEAAGYSRELPRYYYGSKEAFIEALIDECTGLWAELLQDPARRGLVGESALIALFDSLFSVFDRPQFIRGRVLLILELAGTQSPRLRKKLNSAAAATRDRIIRLLERDIAEGAATENLDIPALAALLAGAYRGVGYQWILDPKSIDMNAVSQNLRFLFEHVLKPRVS